MTTQEKRNASLTQTERARRVGKKIRAAIRARRFRLGNQIGLLRPTQRGACGCAIGAVVYVLTGKRRLVDVPFAMADGSLRLNLARSTGGLCQQADLQQIECGFEGWVRTYDEGALRNPNSRFYQLGRRLRLELAAMTIQERAARASQLIHREINHGRFQIIWGGRYVDRDVNVAVGFHAIACRGCALGALTFAERDPTVDVTQFSDALVDQPRELGVDAGTDLASSEDRYQLEMGFEEWTEIYRGRGRHARYADPDHPFYRLGVELRRLAGSR